MNSKRLLAALFLLVPLAGSPAAARMPEPATVPPSLKGGEPHDPAVAVYYLQELVDKHLMTPEEADRTETYLMFRHARRQQDLKEVQGLAKEERRAIMKHKRELRGNPLVEYANYCGFTFERARELMDIMHDSDKGTRYYNRIPK